LVQCECVPEGVGECRQLTNDGIVDGINFGFKVINKGIEHVMLWFGVGGMPALYYSLTFYSLQGTIQTVKW
jgi:hypothetical protein